MSKIADTVPKHKRSMAYRRRPFWDRVDEQIERTAGCWLWTGGTLKKGYGIAHDAGKHRLIHRAMWERANGPIPEGLFVLHRCDVPRCVNPAHLFLGTILDNNRDREAKGRGGQLRGAKHHRPMAKLTNEKVAEIKAKLAHPYQGIGSKLAKEYGVSQSIISGIRHGTGWSHVGS